MTALERRRLFTGLAFIAPWIAGFALTTAYPLLASAYLSFTSYSVLSEPAYVGLANYTAMASDPVFWQAVWNTLFFAAITIPAGLLTAFGIALLLNFDLPGTKVFRTIYYLPALVPMVCLAVLWQWLLNGQAGLLNSMLRPLADFASGVLHLDLAPPNWLAEPAYAKFGLALATLWTVGNVVVIFLAGLQEVPRHLYEAAEIDGCGFLQKTCYVTLPVISPILYFNAIMALIGSLQAFALPYVVSGGADGPGRSLLFVATYIYQNAFDYWNMGYACAVSLVLFAMILLLTLAATRLSEKHIYYAGK